MGAGSGDAKAKDGALMGDVVPFMGYTKLDIPCNQMLENIKGCDLATVVVIGIKDGEPSFYSSTADGGTIIILMEKFKQLLLEEAKFV